MDKEKDRRREVSEKDYKKMLEEIKIWLYRELLGEDLVWVPSREYMESLPYRPVDVGESKAVRTLTERKTSDTKRETKRRE
jgi:hypothetical protein